LESRRQTAISGSPKVKALRSPRVTFITNPDPDGDSILNFSSRESKDKGAATNVLGKSNGIGAEVASKQSINKLRRFQL